VLRETDPQTTLWELLLPEEAKRLPAELAQIDAYLDDERFIAPWRALFDRRLGRPSVPVDTLLRLLYLKHRYGLGYETLCKEVSDSISWRRFCRIGLDRPVPHPTTLVKLVRRAGPQTIEELNAALLAKLAEGKLLRARKLRVDTTVVEADIDYPTDADLLEQAVRKLGGLVRRVKARGAASRTRFRDRGRAAGRRMKQLARRCGGGPGWRWRRWIGSPARSPSSRGTPCGRCRSWHATPAGCWPADLVMGGLVGWSPSWRRRSATPGGCWPRPTSGWLAIG
jgi:IS5 family transposase